MHASAERLALLWHTLHGLRRIVVLESGVHAEDGTLGLVCNTCDHHWCKACKVLAPVYYYYTCRRHCPSAMYMHNALLPQQLVAHFGMHGVGLAVVQVPWHADQTCEQHREEQERRAGEQDAENGFAKYEAANRVIRCPTCGEHTCCLVVKGNSCFASMH